MLSTPCSTLNMNRSAIIFPGGRGLPGKVIARSSEVTPPEFVVNGPPALRSNTACGERTVSEDRSALRYCGLDLLNLLVLQL